MDKTEPEAKKRPDFPQWIETKDGKDCLAWPISEIKYLHNRLFWAFDAGRNCVWDQYMSQKEEITRLKAIIEKAFFGDTLKSCCHWLNERGVIKSII
jgi:hypothetical protein